LQFLQRNDHIPKGNYAPVFAHVEHVGVYWNNSLTKWPEIEKAFDEKCAQPILQAKYEKKKFLIGKIKFQEPEVEFYAWGGWNHPYDINLCLLATETNPHRREPLKLVERNKEWVSKCQGNFLPYVNLTFGALNLNFNLNFTRTSMIQLPSIEMGDMITGKFRADVKSVHFMSFEVIPESQAEFVEVELILKSGLTFPVPKNSSYYQGQIRIDFDPLPDPRVPEEQIKDWKTEIDSFRLVMKAQLAALKIGCFGFWMKKAG